MQVKSFGNMIILGVSVIICVLILALSFVIIKTRQTGHIAVTGSATTSFTSDLIVWRGSFSGKAMTLKDAYAKLKTDADTVRNYLLQKGVREEEIIFSSIGMREDYKDEYTADRNFVKKVFDGYTLRQEVTIQSGEVDKVEMVSRDITKLIDAGVVFFSRNPEYYYTKLDEMKIGLISKATENARLRAEKIIEQSGGEISRLRSASLGVFQITAENSSAEDYSYGGAFDVSSKNKTAFITARLEYSVK
jgi:hypothetical protein